MDLSELLNSAIGQSIVRNVAGQLGVDENQASSAVSMAIPAILAGMTRNAQSQSGRSLNKALESKHDGSLLETSRGAAGPYIQNLQSERDGILGMYCVTTRTVVGRVSRRSGIV